MNAKTKYKAKKIKVVFFDIDDTLRVKDTGFMPDSIKDAFKSLREKGIYIGIASGRAIYGVVSEILALDPDFLITVNGACCIDNKANILADNAIPQNEVEEFVRWCHEVGIEYGMVGMNKAVISKREDFITDAIYPVYQHLDVDPDFYKENAVYQMWTFEQIGDSLQLPESLAKDLRLVRWHEHSSDVVLSHMSKAVGISQVMEHLGLKPENLLVFGDGLNDREMFEYAGLKVALGNAHEEIKALADYVTDTVEEDGVYNALVKLGLVEKKMTFYQINLDKAEGPVATIKTNMGDLKVKLFPEQAPKTVANFVALAKDGYYDGIIFHRIINDFMIQGGDPTGTGMGGESIYGEAFEDEFSEDLYNLRGALSMANAGPNTNGSQFFIVQNKNFPYNAKELERGGWPKEIAEAYVKGGTPHLDRRHTVFGQLMDEASYEVLDAIAAVETDAMDKPKEEVVITGIEVED